jgi:hypothetical protein
MDYPPQIQTLIDQFTNGTYVHDVLYTTYDFLQLYVDYLILHIDGKYIDYIIDFIRKRVLNFPADDLGLLTYVVCSVGDITNIELLIKLHAAKTYEAIVYSCVNVLVLLDHLHMIEHLCAIDRYWLNKVYNYASCMGKHELIEHVYQKYGMNFGQYTISNNIFHAISSNNLDTMLWWINKFGLGTYHLDFVEYINGINRVDLLELVFDFMFDDDKDLQKRVYKYICCIGNASFLRVLLKRDIYYPIENIYSDAIMDEYNSYTNRRFNKTKRCTK